MLRYGFSQLTVQHRIIILYIILSDYLYNNEYKRSSTTLLLNLGIKSNGLFFFFFLVLDFMVNRSRILEKKCIYHYLADVSLLVNRSMHK